MVIRLNKTFGTKLLLLVLYILAAVFFSIDLTQKKIGNVHEWANYCTMWSIVFIVLQCIILKIYKIGFFSLEFIFTILMYTFYLGQTFLLSISYDFGNLTYSIAYITYGTECYIESTKYSFTCILFAFVGLITVSLFKNPYQNENTIKERYNKKTWSLDLPTARLLFILSAPFELYSLGAKILTMLSGSYTEAHAVGGGILVEFMSGIFFASLVMFLLLNSKDKTRCHQTLVLIIIYEWITMLTGQRAMGIIKVFLIIFIYCKIRGRINLKTGLKYAMLFLFASYLLVVIRNTREYGLSISSLDISTNGFLLYDVLSEFGITGKVVTAAFVKTQEFAEGKSLGCAFLAVIPGWSNLFGDDLISKYYTFVALDQQAWGSSFISDFYFDFGYLGGIIASGIYTIIVGSAFKKFYTYLDEGEYLRTSCYAYFVLQYLFTIRSYVFRLPRYFLYFLIIYGGCRLIIKGLAKRH